jgi:hypothetical protein
MLIVAGVFAAIFYVPKPPGAELCSERWFEEIEGNYHIRTSDEEGHGPIAVIQVGPFG